MTHSKAPLDLPHSNTRLLHEGKRRISYSDISFRLLVLHVQIVRSILVLSQSFFLILLLGANVFYKGLLSWVRTVATVANECLPASDY